MTVLHTGATEKFVSGWENIFGDKPSRKKGAAGAKAAAPNDAKKKPAVKTTAVKKSVARQSSAKKGKPAKKGRK